MCSTKLDKCLECSAVKRLQSHYKVAWQRGYNIGYNGAGVDAKHALEALRKEQQGRLDDNATFTEEILRLEERVEFLEGLVRRYESDE